MDQEIQEVGLLISLLASPFSASPTQKKRKKEMTNVHKKRRP